MTPNPPGGLTEAEAGTDIITTTLTALVPSQDAASLVTAAIVTVYQGEMSSPFRVFAARQILTAITCPRS